MSNLLNTPFYYSTRYDAMVDNDGNYMDISQVNRDISALKESHERLLNACKYALGLPEQIERSQHYKYGAAAKQQIDEIIRALSEAVNKAR